MELKEQGYGNKKGKLGNKKGPSNDCIDGKYLLIFGNIDWFF